MDQSPQSFSDVLMRERRTLEAQATECRKAALKLSNIEKKIDAIDKLLPMYSLSPPPRWNNPEADEFLQSSWENGEPFEEAVPAPRGVWLTTERLDALRRLIGEGKTPGQYCPVLAALPGPEMPSNKTVQNRAISLGIRYPDEEPVELPSSGDTCATRRVITQSPPQALPKEDAVIPKISRMEAIVRVVKIAPAPQVISHQREVNVLTRDGAISIAGRQDRDNAEALEAAPAAREDIIAWAKANRIGAADKKIEACLRSKAMRAATSGLPPFRMVAT